MKPSTAHVPLKALLLVGLIGLSAPLKADRIAAVGRVVPAAGLIELEGPAGDAVDEVLVKPGSVVAAGATLLSLQSRPAAEAELAQAEAALRELRGQQPLVVEQAQLTLQQAQADAEFAERSLQRQKQGGIDRAAPQVFDQHAHAARMAQLRAKSAAVSLEALTRGQPTALERSTAGVTAAKTRLQRSVVTAPTAGTILQVDAVPGAATGRGRALVTLADLSKMAVVGDVFEGDLKRVAVGQSAVVSGKSLGQELKGKVVHVGAIIAGAGKTGRVTVEVTDGAALSRLINAEVDLMIEL